MYHKERKHGNRLGSHGIKNRYTDRIPVLIQLYPHSGKRINRKCHKLHGFKSSPQWLTSSSKVWPSKGSETFPNAPQARYQVFKHELIRHLFHNQPTAWLYHKVSHTWTGLLCHCLHYSERSLHLTIAMAKGREYMRRKQACVSSKGFTENVHDYYSCSHFLG